MNLNASVPVGAIRVTCFCRGAEARFAREMKGAGEKPRSKSGHNGSCRCLQRALPISSSLTGSKVAAAHALAHDGAGAPYATRTSAGGPQQRRHARSSRGALADGGAFGSRVGDGGGRSLRARAARARARGAGGRIDCHRPSGPLGVARRESPAFAWCVRALRLLAPPELVWALPALHKASGGAS